MAQLTINDGTTANDGTGDSLRVAAYKINANFTEVYQTINGLSLVGFTGDYNDISINKPFIPSSLRDLSDPLNDLEQVRGTITSNLVTNGSPYNIGTQAANLGTLHIGNVESSSELSLIGNGITIDGGQTANFNVIASTLGVTVTNQLAISASSVQIIAPLEATTFKGDIIADNGATLIDASAATVRGSIDNSSGATFSGNVNFTNATVTGLAFATQSDITTAINGLTIPADVQDLTDTTGILNNITGSIDGNLSVSGTYDIGTAITGLNALYVNTIHLDGIQIDQANNNLVVAASVEATDFVGSAASLTLTDNTVFNTLRDDHDDLRDSYDAFVNDVVNATTNQTTEGTDNSVGETSPGAGDGTNNLYYTDARVDALLLTKNYITDSYTPTTAGDWTSPPPTTIGEAIDRLAAVVATLNGGTGA